MISKPRQLNIDRITTAAFDLLDEKGLETFSLRQLAVRLNVHVSALYRHFKNKEALLLHLTEVMLAQPSTATPEHPRTNWQDWLLCDARRLRENLLTHRDGPQLCMAYHQSIASPHSLALFEVLDSNGFSDRDAAYCVSTLVNYVIGFTLEENYQKRTQQARSAGAEFEYGLHLFLEGMKSKVPS